MGFPRQEYWSGWPFPSSGNLPDPRIELTSPVCSALVGGYFTTYSTQVVKNPPVKQEKQVQSLGWEDPLKKETATHSSILVWEIPGTEEPGGL